MIEAIDLGTSLTMVGGKEKKREDIGGGVLKITFLIEDHSLGRAAGAVLTLGFSEIFCDHFIEVVRYFYEDIFIGNDRDEAGRYAKTKADELFANGQYKTAGEWYNAAYYASPKGCSEEELFKKCRQNSEAQEFCRLGDECFDSGDYEEAFSYYDKAHKNCSEDFGNKSEFYTKICTSKVEVLNKKSKELMKMANYEEAYKVLEEACELCPDSYYLSILLRGRRKEAKAQYKHERGLRYFEKKNFEEARKCFEKAQYVSIFSESDIMERSKENLANTKAEILNQKADQLFKSKDYSKAKELYKQALETCSGSYQGKKNFYNNYAISISEYSFQKGLDHLNKQQFEEAHNEFQNAFKTCPNYYKNENVFKKFEQNSQAELFNKTGCQFLERGNYADAHKMFLKAVQLSSDDYSRASVFSENSKKALVDNSGEDLKSKRDQVISKDNPKAEELAEEAKKHMAASNFKDAVNFYSLAYETCTKGYENEKIFKESLKNARSELFNSMGMQKLKENKILEAKELIQKAISTCQHDYSKRKDFQKNLELVIKSSKTKKEQNESDDEKLKVQEALRLNDEGLRLYKDGKLKESLNMLEDALSKYDDALKKFKEATALKVLNIFFNSFLKIIIAFVRNEAYDDAESAIADARALFSPKAKILDEVQKVIDDESSGIQTFDRYLIEVDEVYKNIGADLVQLAEAF